jgi:CheY-like chemotaxis protein
LSPAPARRARLTPAAGLALQLWLTSMLCWWIIGIPFSRLWWLVNASQQRWRLPTPGGSGNGAGGCPLALVIDDERSVRTALARYFERGGWEVRQAEDGSEALELLADPAASAYQVVITDLRMPGRTGVEVHDWLAEHRPELFERLIIATGDVASPSIREFIRRTTRPVLEKPFELGALAALVQRVTAGR